MKVWDIRGNKPEFIMERQMNLGLIQVSILGAKKIIGVIY